LSLGSATRLIFENNDGVLVESIGDLSELSIYSGGYRSTECSHIVEAIMALLSTKAHPTIKSLTVQVCQVNIVNDPTKIRVRGMP
jgi:hypothetical protein